MAAKTWFVTNTLVSNHQQLSETSPGADATTSPQVGWVVGTTAPTVYSEFDGGTKQANGTFSATARPDGSINTAGDCWRTATTYKGTFASANWTINGVVIGVTNSGAQDGRMRFRLFRSANADGSGATEITGAAQVGSTVTNLSTTQQNSSVTFNPGSFSVDNEYIFVQVGWEITGAGGMSTTDVVLRIGNTAARVVTSDFTETRTITASIDGVVRSTQTITASIDAVVRSTRTATASVDAIAQTTRTATASVDAYVDTAGGFTGSITASVDAVVQARRTVTASVDAVVQERRTATASVDAVVRARLTASSQIDAVVESRRTLTASVDGVVQARLNRTASIDAIAQARLSLTTSVDAVVRAARTATASIDAYVSDGSVPRSLTTSIDAIVQARRSANASVDAVVRGRLTLTASIDAYVAEAATIAVIAPVAERGSVASDVTIRFPGSYVEVD